MVSRPKSRLFFETSTLDELFEDISEKENLSKDVICSATEPYPFRCDKAKSYYYYCAFTGNGKHLYIKPTEKVLGFLSDMMDNIVDGPKHFEIVSRNDGKYLVMAKYDTIIGSYWLNAFEEDEVKTFLEKV